MITLDMLLTLLGFALPLFYHATLLLRYRRRPLSTSSGLMLRARSRWVEMVMTERRDVLAVQTLRNWEMSATFLASTAIFLSLGLLGVLLSSEQFGALARRVTGDAAQLWVPVDARVGLVAGNFALAFFNFTIAIRYFNFVGFLAALPVGREACVDEKRVDQMLARASTHFTFGMRGYYLALPLTLWLLGSGWMLAGSLALVVVLYKLDFID